MFERKMPAHFGGALWADHTLASPFGLFALALALVAILLLPRRKIVLPLLLIAVGLPGAQRIAIFSLDFTFLRITILTTLLAALARGHFKTVRFGKPDLLLFLWTIWGLIAYGLLMGNIGGVISSAGGAIDTFGAYLVGRTYIRSTDDMRRFIMWLALISFPMVLLFLLERTTGHNIFSIFGGVPAETMVRNGQLRCQGPFSHPIMAGVFWASVLPCIAALWMGKVGARVKIALAIFCMLLIVINTSSSTPLMAVILGIGGMSLYIFRRNIRLFFYGAVAVLVSLHIVMEMPVWHLLARIDLANGSTGWHRYNLIQQSINHFGEWWMVGTTSTAHWGWGLQDITNQFVLEGVNGGLLKLLLFVLFLAAVYLRIGRSLRFANSKAESWIIWGAGVSLFVHCLSFLAVSYFGQTVELFYLFVGGVVSMTSVRSIAQSSRSSSTRAIATAQLNGAA